MTLPVREDDLLTTAVEDRRKWPVERIMGVLGFIGGVVTLVFTIGVTYQNMKSLETRFAEHLAKDAIDKSEFQRRDVSLESTRRLEGKVDDLSREFRALREQIGRINQARR